MRSCCSDILFRSPVGPRRKRSRSLGTPCKLGIGGLRFSGPQGTFSGHRAQDSRRAFHKTSNALVNWVLGGAGGLALLDVPCDTGEIAHLGICPPAHVPCCPVPTTYFP